MSPFTPAFAIATGSEGRAKLGHPRRAGAAIRGGGGSDGLALYRRLLEQLPGVLAPGAALFFEAAPPTIDGLVALVEGAFAGAHVEIGEDYAGLERFVSAALA